MHGSISNMDSMPRISFDFRIAFSPYSIGVKRRGVDYVDTILEMLLMDKKDNWAKCKSIVSTQGKLSHLTHITQRAIISDFCHANNLIPEIEGSEYYTLDHFPLREWISQELESQLSQDFQ